MLLAVLALLGYVWLGFIADDDWEYADAASHWLNGLGPGSSHWSLRPAVVAPLAASFALLGFNTFSLGLPTALYFLGLLFLTYRFMAAAAGAQAALIATGLVGTLPILLLYASMASADITELFFVALSFWLFWAAAEARRPWLWLLAAGLAAGGAWLARELVVGLLAFYALLFVFRVRYRRSEFWLIAAGFVLVMAAEMTLLTMLGKDPLYRLGVVSAHSAGFVGPNGSRQGR